MTHKWRREIENPTASGRAQLSSPAIEEGRLEGDQYAQLLQRKDALGGAATVSVTWGRAGQYGDPKITVTVTLMCDQHRDTIDTAGFLAYSKAVELVDEVIRDFDERNKE